MVRETTVTRKTGAACPVSTGLVSSCWVGLTTCAASTPQQKTKTLQVFPIPKASFGSSWHFAYQTEKVLGLNNEGTHRGSAAARSGKSYIPLRVQALLVIQDTLPRGLSRSDGLLDICLQSRSIRGRVRIIEFPFYQL